MNMAKAVAKPSQVAAQKATEKTAAKAEPAQTATPKYPVPVVKIHHPEWEKFKAATGQDIYAPPLTMEDAKRLLGWQTEADYIARLKLTDPNLNEDAAKEIFGKDFFLTDLEGNKVKLHNNTRNRPWTEGVSKAYMQDILKKHWEFNGETVIIGQFGRVLSGQHRLIGLVYAEQSRTLESEKEHWNAFWKDAIRVPMSIMYGIEESSKVTRSIDNVKSRTLSDVIIADTDMFGAFKSTERKSAARMLDYCVKLLWERMGESGDKWAPKRTHSESLDFVDRHSKIKECIKHVLEEEKGDDKRISQYIYPGHAAALLYMMATTGTPSEDLDDYYAKMLEQPSHEKGLKFNNLKKAKMFWSDLARRDPSVKAVCDAFCPIPGDDPERGFSGKVFIHSIDGKAFGGDGKPDECIGVLVKAWNQYVKDEPITQESIELLYEAEKTDENTRDGRPIFVYELKEHPRITQSADNGKKVKEKKAPKVTPEANPDALTELSDAEADEIANESQTNAPPKEKDGNAERKQWEADKKDYSGHVLVYTSPVTTSENMLVYFDDAELWASLQDDPKPRVSPHPTTGVVRCVLSPQEVDIGAQKVMEAGHEILLVSRPDKDGKRVISPYQLTEDEEVNEQGDDVPDDDDDTEDEDTNANNDENGNRPPTPVATPSAPRVVVRKR